MRLFVAIDLNDEARRAVAEVQARVAQALGHRPVLRWVDPARLHMTLAFIGEVDEARGGALAAVMADDVDLKPFEIVWQGLGVFPGRGAPRVLWLGVAGGADRLPQLVSDVGRRIARAGVGLEARPWHAHLTLARWRASARPRPPDARRALAADPATPVARTTVDHVTLYESRLSPAGPAYTARARARLT